jgi:ABC-type dipeptide/oligopeptide/nickel transport system permease component
MTSYVIKRILLIIPTVLGAVTILFFIFFMLPGDPARVIAGGNNRNPNPEVIARIKARYDLDKPLVVQYADYVGRTAKWDLGESYQNRRSVNEILGQKAKNSFRLAFWAIVIEIIVGISVGLVSAMRRYSWTDTLLTVITSAMSAIPAFVLGYMLIYLFTVWPHQHGLPQLKSFGIGPNSWALGVIPTGDQWKYLVLPAVTLACVSTALAARMTRGSMLEVQGSDYMRTARAKGLTERKVVTNHGLRNAMLPVVTLIGLDFGTAIGAAVLTETTFTWPGLGSQIAQSVNDRDLPVLLGLTLVVVLAYAFVNIVVDVSYAWFDPRIRLGEGEHA